MAEKRKHRFGDRRDGRKIRSLPPMQYVTPYIMKTRNDANNLFESKVDCATVDEYIRKKREQGYPGFGFMHVLVAAYVRTISQRPALNRYIAGQKLYQRDDIVLSMMVKKELKMNAQESSIKVVFDPRDTAVDVYRKIEDAIVIARQEGDSTALDKVARAITKMPSLILRWFVGLMNLLDYFGIMPKVIDTASPFHCSIFISNLGSLGIPPIYHHLYNFGNCPNFICFGTKEKALELDRDGNVTEKRYIRYTVVNDERITDGHYMASAFKGFAALLRKPSILDNPPERVVEDVD